MGSSLTSTPVALLYRRISGAESQKQGVSLAAQQAACRQYARNEGWIIAGEYEDVLTGMRDDREGYQRLLSEARSRRAEGRTVYIVVAWLNRFGRRLEERIRVSRELKRLDVAVHAALEGGRQAQVVADVMAVLAEEESRQTGERVQATFKHIAQQGWHTGGRPPWGYRWRQRTAEERAEGARPRVLDVDPVAAEYVRQAFQMAASGTSARQVAVWISQLPAEVKRLERPDGGFAERNLGWRVVQKMLAAPVYISRRYLRDKRKPPKYDRHGHELPQYLNDPEAVLAQPAQRWPAIVGDDTWLKAQSNVSRAAWVQRRASGEFLLTGFARCPRCHGRMTAWAIPGKSVRYKCSTWKPTRCTYSVTAAQVEHDVLHEVYELLRPAVHPASKAAIRRLLTFTRKPDQERIAARIRTLEANAAKAQERISRANDLLVEGRLSDEAYRDVTQRAEAAKLDALTEVDQLRANDLRRGTPDVETVLTHAAEWAQTIESGTTRERRGVLARLVKNVYPIRTGHNAYQVERNLTEMGKRLERMQTPEGQAAIQGVA